MVIKILKVGKLKEILEGYDNKTELTVFLNIVDDKSNYLTGVLFDIDSMSQDGPLIRLNISEKVQDFEKYVEDARKKVQL